MIICVVVTALSIRPAASQTLDQEISPTGTLAPISETVTTTPTIPELTSTDSPTNTATITASVLPTNTATISPTITLTPARDPGHKKVRLLVGTKWSASTEGLMASGMGTVMDPAAIELAKIGISILEVPADKVDQTRAELKLDPDVSFVESDGMVQALDVYPNDPGFPAQYALINIHAPQGWAVSTGSTMVTIAVIDSGVDLSHPDLVDKVLQGYDFIENDPTPQDEYGHGTHVSGIAAASTNNGSGVSGVSWGAQILPVRVLDSHGNGDYSTLAAGIIWAVDHGAQILNLSLGGISPNTTLLKAVNYAYERGVMIIASSGNDGSGNLRYPARYPVVVAVGSTNSLDQRSGYSNYGSGLDLMAPGETIYSSDPGGYAYRTGTSMSAPFVSGLAAILWGMPGYGSTLKVETAIERNALDLGSTGWDAEYGFGLIQMDAALIYDPIPPKPHKTPTPQISNGYLANLALTPSMSASPTQTMILAITPSMTAAASTGNNEVGSMSLIDETMTSTPSRVTPVLTSVVDSPSRHESAYLLLLAGTCFILGGIALILFLVILKDRQNPSHSGED